MFEFEAMQPSFEMKATPSDCEKKCLSLHIKKPSDQYLIQQEEWKEKNPLKEKANNLKRSKMRILNKNYSKANPI